MTEEEQIPQYVNSTVDLNDSQLQLEKFLLSSNASASGGSGRTELLTNQNQFHEESVSVTPTSLSVKSHSSEEILSILSSQLQAAADQNIFLIGEMILVTPVIKLD